MRTTEDGTDFRQSRLKASAGFIAFVVVTALWLLYQNAGPVHPANVDLNQYAIVVDAGSSGSRAYLYFWPPHTGNPRDLLKISPLTDESGEPLVKKATPGLSSFADDPGAVMGYMRPLLDFASDLIPPSHHQHTHLYVLATAGMRLLTKEEQAAILKELETGIKAEYDFDFRDDSLEVISGRQEGIYQWLAVNYILDRFENGEQTVGALDMGGASMQIAMEVPHDSVLSDREMSQVVDINLGCRDQDSGHKYRLFVTTFLGYGANEALARYRRQLILSQPPNKGHISGLAPNRTLSDACLHRGNMQAFELRIDLDKLADSEMKRVLEKTDHSKVYLEGTGEWEQCYSVLGEFVKAKEAYYVPCQATDDSCPDDGIRIPSVKVQSAPFYAFSEFWYTMEHVFGLGGRYHFPDYQKNVKAFCQSSWSQVWDRFQTGHYGTLEEVDEESVQTKCFKSVWIAVALHEGFKFSTNETNLTSAPNTVEGKVAHWTVGALLYRTRFVPLKKIKEQYINDIQKEENVKRWSSGFRYSQFMLLVCLAVTLIAITLCARKCRRCISPFKRRQPSLPVPHAIKVHRTFIQPPLQA